MACGTWDAMLRATASNLHEHYRADLHNTALHVCSVDRSCCAAAGNLKLAALPVLPMGTRASAGTAPPEIAGTVVCLLGPALFVWLRCGSQVPTRVGSFSNKVLLSSSFLPAAFMAEASEL